MAQLSRPYQIALVALALLVLVWFAAIHGHNSSTSGGSQASASASSAPSSGSSASANSASTSAAAEARAAAAPSHVYTGPVPGLQGLTRDINRAHGAVAQSQTEAKHLESADVSGTSTTGSAASSSSTTVIHNSATGKTTVVHTHRTTTAPSKPGASSKSGAAAPPSMQAAVERELGEGKTVLILFWNPHGADDAAVHSQLPAVARSERGKVAIHYASAAQVGAFGSVTNAIQVNQTPTLLIVNPHGQTQTITGLTDAFAIEQAISESHSA